MTACLRAALAVPFASAMADDGGVASFQRAAARGTAGECAEGEASESGAKVPFERVTPASADSDTGTKRGA